MAQPTSEELQTLDFSFNAQPFVSIAAKSSIEGDDFSFDAQPFYVTPSASTTDTGTFFLLFF